MKRRVWVAAVTSLLVVSGMAHADQVDDIKKKGELVVGVLGTDEPMSFIDPKTRELVGYDVDLGKAVAAKLGVKPVFKQITLAARIPELQQGHIDLLAASLTHSKEREAQIDFSLTTYVTGTKVLVRTNSGIKDVPDLAHVGFPIARIEADGRCTISKPEHTGGLINAQTVKEQLLYEVHDPAAYLTPDVVADISDAWVTEVGPDQVRLEGVRGHARPSHLKINVCSERGWLAEAEISYAGAHALARAQLARQIIATRLGAQGKLRCDFIGVTSVLGDDQGQWLAQLGAAGTAALEAPRDVRVRWAWEQPTARAAEVLLREVNALYTCGPGGGGGVRTQLRSRLSTVSCLLPRAQIPCGWRWWSPAAALP